MPDLMNPRSKDIKVFPFGCSRVNDPFSRTLNEQNITSMVRRLTDFPNYILKYDDNKEKDCYYFELIIQGYYVELTIPKIDLQLSDEEEWNLYACLNVSEVDKTGYSYIHGGDDFEQYDYTSDPDKLLQVTSPCVYRLSLPAGKPVSVKITGLSDGSKITIKPDEGTLKVTSSTDVGDRQYTPQEPFSVEVTVAEEGATGEVVLQLESDSLSSAILLVNPDLADTKFTGVSLQFSKPENNSDYCLAILQKVSDGVTYKINAPENSFKKFNIESFNIDTIICSLD